MANVREQVKLSGFTTLGLGGPARRFVVAGTDQEIIAAVRDADRRGEQVLVLGGGSNLVISDNGFPRHRHPGRDQGDPPDDRTGRGRAGSGGPG